MDLLDSLWTEGLFTVSDPQYTVAQMIFFKKCILLPSILHFLPKSIWIMKVWMWPTVRQRKSQVHDSDIKIPIYLSAHRSPLLKRSHPHVSYEGIMPLSPCLAGGLVTTVRFYTFPQGQTRGDNNCILIPLLSGKNNKTFQSKKYFTLQHTFNRVQECNN